MGLFDFLLRLFFGKRPSPAETARPQATDRRRRRPRLVPLRAVLQKSWTRNATLDVKEPPYAFARLGIGSGQFLDLSQDADDARLARFALPAFRTPEQLADWLGMPLGRLAWLVHRFSDNSRPATEAEAHYHFRWLPKRRGGHRLIESPKQHAQRSAAQDPGRNSRPGSAARRPPTDFAPGRSIVTNATPHVNQALLLKFDLADFYATVTFARVTAIFRGLGYSREAAIWLARLTTSALPANIPFLKQEPSAVLPYLATALAPRSADVARAGEPVGLFARCALVGSVSGVRCDLHPLRRRPHLFRPRRIRPFAPRLYPARDADHPERTFPGEREEAKSDPHRPALVVTGVVVNEKVNVRRRQFDRLKAVLVNCVRQGPSTQNRAGHPRYADHLRGRVAHVSQLNADRGAKLLALYEQIDWKR